MNKKAGFTLIELLIAIGLVGMIILAITAIDVASRRFLNTTNYEAQVQSEASPVVGRIVKDISMAYGQSANPGISITNTNRRITIRRLDDSPSTYDNFDDDPLVRYTYNIGQNDIAREASPCSGGAGCPSWGTAETIARNIEACAFTQGADSIVTIDITARRIADGSPVTFENPRVILETSVFPRSSSLN